MPTAPRPRLADLRRSRQFSQQHVATALDLARTDVSKLERRDDPRLSSLIRYVEALGGRLELLARFGDERIPVAFRAPDGKAGRV